MVRRARSWHELLSRQAHGRRQRRLYGLPRVTCAVATSTSGNRGGAETIPFVGTQKCHAQTASRTQCSPFFRYRFENLIRVLCAREHGPAGNGRPEVASRSIGTIGAVPNFWPIGARVDPKATIHCRLCGWLRQEFGALVRRYVGERPAPNSTRSRRKASRPARRSAGPRGPVSERPG